MRKGSCREGEGGLRRCTGEHARAAAHKNTQQGLKRRKFSKLGDSHRDDWQASGSGEHLVLNAALTTHWLGVCVRLCLPNRRKPIEHHLYTLYILYTHKKRCLYVELTKERNVLQLASQLDTQRTQPNMEHYYCVPFFWSKVEFRILNQRQWIFIV